MASGDDGIANNQAGRTVSSNPPCPDEGRETRQDPAHYVLRIFYYNPGDPAVIVPMRWGSGIDFNYTLWPGKVAVTIIGALLIYALLLIFL